MDEEYFLARMRSSLGMAQKARDGAVRLIHYELAGRYSVWAVDQHASKRIGS